MIPSRTTYSVAQILLIESIKRAAASHSLKIKAAQAIPEIRKSRETIPVNDLTRTGTSIFGQAVAADKN